MDETGASPRTSALLMAERIANFGEGNKNIFHDTAGWKNLETFMKYDEFIVLYLSPDFSQSPCDSNYWSSF